MDDLNSVLIEGRVVNGPCWTGDTEPARAWFDIETASRALSPSGRDLGGTFHVEVVGRLATACMDTLQQGMSVRVVGKLTRNGTCPAYIWAEHVEFRAPRPTRAPAPVEGAAV